MSRSPRAKSLASNDFLIGVLSAKRDLDILLSKSWYRIPIGARTGVDWPPKWLGFYEGTPIRAERGIYRFAEVLGSEQKSREELFPDELPGAKRGKIYHVLHVGPIQERPAAVRFPRPRRFAFIGTTFGRFQAADTVNDLFADSPLEDDLWQAFKESEIPAERQWRTEANGRNYVLDFALFCREGKIDVETDGDSYHITTVQSPLDNQRNNDLATRGWEVLRFETLKIRKHISKCVDDVLQAVETLKGFESPKLVPTRYVKTTNGMVPQLTMFEQRTGYDVEVEED